MCWITLIENERKELEPIFGGEFQVEVNTFYEFCTLKHSMRIGIQRISDYF